MKKERDGMDIMREKAEDDKKEKMGKEKTIVISEKSLGDLINQAFVLLEKKECPNCDGKGTCPTCDGYGYVKLQPRTECPDCSGSGSCRDCDGSGKIKKEE